MYVRSDESPLHALQSSEIANLFTVDYYSFRVLGEVSFHNSARLYSKKFRIESLKSWWVHTSNEVSPDAGRERGESTRNDGRRRRVGESSNIR